MGKIIKIESCDGCAWDNRVGRDVCLRCQDDPTPALEARVKELEAQNEKLLNYNAKIVKENMELEATLRRAQCELHGEFYGE